MSGTVINGWPLTIQRGGKEYRYVEAYHYPTYEKARYENRSIIDNPKTFSYRHSDGNGGWIYNLDNVEQSLCGLEELDKVSKQDWVIFTEGEKDKNRLSAEGFVVCTSGGVNSWQKKFSRHFRGRLVALCGDNDAAGKKFIQQVANDIHGVAMEARVLELPGLPPKGDISDWLNNGGTKAKLIELIDAAKPFVPTK